LQIELRAGSTWPRKFRKSCLKLEWTCENFESNDACVNGEDFNFIEKLSQAILQAIIDEHDNACTDLLN
jgi:hypothetical protein